MVPYVDYTQNGFYPTSGYAATHRHRHNASPETDRLQNYRISTCSYGSVLALASRCLHDSGVSVRRRRMGGSR